ncbi:Myosin type-2 heavy chain 1, partial [Apophysomyces sp. BC1034]
MQKEEMITLKQQHLRQSSVRNIAADEADVFPAHVIGLCATQMWRFGYLPESEKLMNTVMDAVQKYCLSFSGEDTTVPCAFWLSNSHELLSLLCSTERELEREMQYNVMHGRRAVGWHDFEKLASNIKYELQCLEDNIYHHWLTELKKKLEKIVVPAVIEHQSLPRFNADQKNGMFGKYFSRSAPDFTMDDLLNFLNKIHRTMKCYYVEPSVLEQVFTELMRLI